MGCGKCGCGNKTFCPLTLGVALGLTTALALVSWSLYVIYQGGGPGVNVQDITFMNVLYYGLWAFIKAFVFGFVLGAIYNLLCCCRKKLLKNKCACNCECHQGCATPNVNSSTNNSANNPNKF